MITQFGILKQMDAYHRPLVDELCKRLEEPPQFLIAIYGPCQAGKTTMILQALERLGIPHHYFATNQQDDSRGITLPTAGTTVPLEVRPSAESLIRHWRSARERVKPPNQRFVLVLDEIHEILGWSHIVKGLWDEDRRKGIPLHVVFLGSAPPSIQTSLGESMMGRFEPLRVPHWSFSEMAQAFGFGLDHYLFYGGYPRVASHIADEQRWRNYITENIVKRTIDRDVLSLVRVDKPRLMKLLLDLCVDYSGKILSYNKMLGILHDAVNTTTLAHYLQLLSEIDLAIGLERYSRNPRIARTSSPKLNVLNTALLTASRRYSFQQAVADRTFWGQIVEAAVGAHLVNSGSTATRVYYWRDGVLEVDFVLTRGPEVIAVEVTSGRRLRPTRGMEEFSERFNPHRSLLVGEGGIPLEEFLSVPVDHWFDTM